jgi:hypothetical protein
MMAEFPLNGLSAGNLLAYLAALGTLKTASLAWPTRQVTVEWRSEAGAWRPRLALEGRLSEDELIEGLSKLLADSRDLPALNLGDNLGIAVEQYRSALHTAQAAAEVADRRDIDFMAAFGSEAIQSKVNGKPTGQIADTAFRTMSGAGHQHFLGTIRTFIADTRAEHLHKALFCEWRYDDPLKNHSMRWDPQDDIRYALRWQNPSGDPERVHAGSVWGANRLAIEALTLFPCLPEGDKLETTGFVQGLRGQSPELTWPVWKGPLGIDCVASLIPMDELRKRVPNRTWLRRIGVVEVFRCKRITQGKFRNFTPAVPA